ncbi:hypothetical protein HW555_001320 [Spodoptera exigua]|uniref:Guanine nucleotide exchange factor DBS n=1 Tax=Spodoptera exigua TaxID=7107 RepID=A0A835LAJ6_SPOEX|nr:hypothetical protein HW555_001320 [Spodoptera exigua]
MKMETSGGSESSGGEDADARQARRGHVLAELLQTERVYVQELGSILTRLQKNNEGMEPYYQRPLFVKFTLHSWKSSSSNNDSYVRSLHSTLSCRKPNRCLKSNNITDNHHYSYAYASRLCNKNISSIHDKRKTQSLNRNQTFGNWSSTLQTLKKKTMFWKINQSLTQPSECKCLETIYEDYDRRLQDWCDTISHCTSLISGYKDEIEKPENQHLLPSGLVGQADVLFGNLHELFTFHQDIFLKDLEKSISATEFVALCFVEKRDTFFRLYSYYCQNIPRSERLRETLVDTHLFLQACQLRLGHKLPLAAYLLKPVQRITKYQLLLKLDLSQQGELLMQGSFLVVSENKRDLRLRIRPRRRHIFLYEKAMLFCKPATKNSHNKATYHFKHDLQMSQIGLTESVKGDVRKFEVWRQGRAEVHTLTAGSADVKRAWVERIKRPAKPSAVVPSATRTASCDTHDEPCWSTDPSDDDDDEPEHPPVTEAVGLNGTIHRMVQFFSVAGSAQATSTFYAVGCALVALSDYTAVGPSEVSLREGQHAELLKVGCAGWWYVVRVRAGRQRRTWTSARRPGRRVARTTGCTTTEPQRASPEHATLRSRTVTSLRPVLDSPDYRFQTKFCEVYAAFGNNTSFFLSSLSFGQK